MSRFPLLVAALLCFASGAAAQHGASSPRPQDGPATIALFVARPGEGDAPLSVHFKDRSFGHITSWVWEFGDGQTSNLQNPTHVYTEGGVYDIRLTVTGPYGTAKVGKPGGVIVRRCTLESARVNRVGPLERGEDFVPITGDDSLGFYCVYSGKAVGPDNPRIDNNVGMFLFPLANGEVLLFGAGYGDPNSYVAPTVDAAHDVRRVDAIIRFCMGRVPENTPIRFVTPHGHIDHINADCIRELREHGYPIVDIIFHSRDATWSKGMPGWTSDDRAVFRTVRNETSSCQEELLSFASPLGKIWFFLREGHTPGAMDLVIDVRNETNNRFIVRGSGESYGSCPIPGVREAIEPHGNVLLRAPQPQIFALGPGTGSAFGGTEVVVSGAGFAAPLAGRPLVLFDGSPASDVTVLTDDTLTCVTPPGLPGETVHVKLANKNGQVVLEDGYSYRPLPTLTQATPARGLSSGGTRVTLTGSGFQTSVGAANVVTFGGIPAKSVLVLDDTTLQCTIPPHAPGLVVVALSNENGAAQLATQFLYDPVIDVLGVSPVMGSALGGTRVQINGSAFAVGAALPEVFFGAARATGVVRVSDTRLECTTPAGPSGVAVDVRVSGTNGVDTLAGGFRYFVAPKVTAVAPSSGPAPGGELITLTGSNFSKNAAGANTVTFGGKSAAGIVTVSDTTIHCVAPPGTGGTSVDVVVANANGSGRLERGYRYHGPPTLSSLEPGHGTRAGGTLVTLHGARFQESGAGAATVLFGGTPALEVSVLDDSTLTCRAPAAQSDASVDVEVANANGSARLAQAFRYVSRPVLLGLEPASGPSRGGATVTLHGTGFLAPGAGAIVVRFGSETVADTRVVDDATLVCRTPLGLPDSHADVQVSNQNGSARLRSAYHYLPLPSLAGIAPEEGKASGGTRVRVAGSGFLTDAVPSVRFGAGEARDVVVLDERTLLCTTPPGVQGAVDVSLRTIAGAAVLRAGFVYGPTRPTLSGIHPNHGPSHGGTLVDLEGSNFLASQAGTNTVEFGGVASPLVMAVDDTRIRCVAPPGAPGALVDVRVRNANGIAVRAAAYRYHLQPSLASVAPSQGSSLGGFLVTVHGAGFARDEARDLVLRFGAADATGIQVLDDATLTCRAPQGSPGSVVDLELTNSNGSALLSGALRYLGAPVLQTVAPPGGTPLGGTLVTLTGTDFDAGTGGAGTTTVRFGANAATQLTILSNTTLTCLAPAGASGASVDVRLANPNGGSTLVNAYRYHAAPVLSALAPGNGPSSGGTTVVLTGSGFMSNVVGPNAVSFGGLPARSVFTVDDTHVRAVAPTGTPGTRVDLVLSNSNGSAQVAQGYRYNAAPTLGSVDPPGASSRGGVVVTIHGSGFLRDGAGPNSVLFGAVAAGSVSVQDDQTLTCVTPGAPAGTEVSVSLSNRNGTAGSAQLFRFYPAPRIDELLPTYGFSGGGALVEIRGAGWLTNGAGLNKVTFDASAATEVTVVDDAVLRCRAPAGAAGPVTVLIENSNGAAARIDGFYYDWAPTLTGLQPGQGSSLGGTEVLLTGGGFGTTGAGPLSVRFGGIAATNVRIQNGQSLLCTAPAGPAGTTVAVVVSNSHGSSGLSGFRYNLRPTITSVDPAMGPPEGGTVVTLRGAGFSANGAGIPVVRFGASLASGVTVVDDTTVRCTSPSGPARTSPLLTLDNANGTATFADGFRWLGRAACDLNGDGVGDAVFSGATAVYVFFGATLGLSDESTASADLILRSSVTGSDFGTQLAAGDVNADGIADLAVAAPLDDVGGTDSGAVFVFFGPLSALPTPRLSSTASATFRGAASGDRFGSSVAVCDVTGDGSADLLVGAPFNDAGGTDAGAVYVYGGTAGFAGQSTSQAAVRLRAASNDDSFGASLAAGDLTGDGLDDVVIGAPTQGNGSSGTVHVFRGGPTLASATPSSALAQIDGDSSGDRLGTSVVVADFDGDGIDDLLIGAPDASSAGTSGGAVYLLRGGATLDSRDADVDSVELHAESSGDRLGQALAMGDANGDGRADLLASAPQHDVPAASAGRAYLLLGGPLEDGSIDSRAFTILMAETSAGDQFGAGLALTDLDGDGLADLLVGAPFSNGGGTDSGRVHVFWGANLQATRSAGADDVTFTGATTAVQLGRELGSPR